jgi:hypothetical protein
LRSPLAALSIVQALKEIRLRRGISGFAEITQTNTDQPKTFSWAEIYSLAQRHSYGG